MGELLPGGGAAGFSYDQLEIVVADLLGFFVELDSEHGVVDAKIEGLGRDCGILLVAEEERWIVLAEVIIRGKPLVEFPVLFVVRLGAFDGTLPPTARWIISCQTLGPIQGLENRLR